MQLSLLLSSRLSNTHYRLFVNYRTIVVRYLVGGGDGGEDGLSGWNLIVLPHGKGEVSARLERYDRLIYQTERLSLPAAGESRVLVASIAEDRFSAKLDELVLFDEVPVNYIPGRHRIGVATWGPSPAIERVELSRPR